jgi:hypothetical protein
MEHEDRRVMAKAVQRSSLIQSLCLEVDPSQQGASTSGTPPRGAGSFSKPVDEGELQYVALKVGRLHLAQTRCLEMP